MSSIEKSLGNRQFTPPAPTPAPEKAQAAVTPPEPVIRTQSPMSRFEGADIDIPFDRLHEQGYLTPSKPRSTVAEEFRAIKRPLLKNIAGQSAAPIENANLIMVTSALEGDGKTFSSLSLAMSMAMEQDKTVLYIDADVHKASAGKVLGISDNTPGLIDILLGEAKPEDVILRTSIRNLRFMPAGSRHEKATELLASEKMHLLMEELASRYSDRVIIFDSPPLLLTNESGVLASFMGQIVFVASANRTPQHAVQEALERIGSDKMVALMLNKVPPRRFKLFGISSGYGYGGYGYGYGTGHRENNGVVIAEGQER